jgi:hypothetical protein
MLRLKERRGNSRFQESATQGDINHGTDLR